MVFEFFRLAHLPKFLFVILAELIVNYPPIATSYIYYHYYRNYLLLLCRYVCLCLCHSFLFTIQLFLSLKTCSELLCQLLLLSINLWLTPSHGDYDEACYYYSYCTWNYLSIKSNIFLGQSLWPNPMIILIHVPIYKTLY